MTRTFTPRPPFERRNIPLPASISPEAQAFLARGTRPAVYPPLDDREAWRGMIERTNAEALAALAKVEAWAAKVELREISGVPVYVATPPNLRTRAVAVYFHTGGMVLLGGPVARLSTKVEATRLGCVVFGIDFRTAPDHPFPAALEDCVNVYRAIASAVPPAQTALVGYSGGGNLAAATVLRLKDIGAPLPGCVALISPQVDLTESGDSFQANHGLDSGLGHGTAEFNALYAGDHPLDHPYLSPLFGDLTGFPPTYLQSGTRDLFLSNTVRMHRALLRAGSEAELHIWEGMHHTGFGAAAPETEEARLALCRFLYGNWGMA